MKQIVILFYSILFNITYSQNFELPQNCTVIKKIVGDLDKDGINEIVIVCNLDQTKNLTENFKRKLYILKKNNNHFILFKENSNILNSSKECGFCFNKNSDPLKNIEIKNGSLIIEQETNNNSRRKENNKLIFRFQNNDWFLIGSTYRYWDTCDFDYKYDINFSTNKIIITKINGNCDDVEYKKESKSIKKYNYKFPKVTIDKYKPTELKYDEKTFFYY